MHTYHAQETLLIGRNTAKAHEGADNRDISSIDNISENCSLVRKSKTTADEEQRTLNIFKSLHYILNLRLITGEITAVATQGNLLWIFIIYFSSENILRNINDNWTRTAGAGDKECFTNNTR